MNLLVNSADLGTWLDAFGYADGVIRRRKLKNRQESKHRKTADKIND